MVESGAYRDTTTLFHPPRPSEILQLDFALASLDKVKAVWTEGKLTYLPGQEKLWFEACEKCFTELDVDTNWKIMCPYCKEFTKVTVRSDIGVYLSHGTTVVPASIRSPEIDKLLPFTGHQLSLAAAENKPLTREVEAALENKHVICFLKYYDRENRGIVRIHYPIVKIYTKAEVHQYNEKHPTTPVAEITSELHAPSHDIGSSSSTPEPAIDKQLFTPTIKKVLEGTVAVSSGGKAQVDDQA